MHDTIRLAALDLDGTLLDSEKRLSARNRAALAAAAARGVEIVPSTGRFFDGMPDAVRALPFVRYAITVNGAQVWDRAAGRSLVRAEIPLATAVAVMETLDAFDCIYDCYQDGWGWMTAAMRDRAADYAPDAHYLAMIRDLRSPVPELKAHLAAKGADVQKVMCFARDASLRPAIRAALAARFPELALTASTPNNVEINHALANKGEALRRLCGALGFGPENAMAFGDGLTDLPMVRAAGLGVAMANAAPEVRAAAGFVAPSNDEDGVAAALERFVLSPPPHPATP
ncbi:MAG: Cof-type HAD-IIB family hydrolase [Kiritimatiellae bacterium]|nr:Cof-type HAD-IIB family hydrolase [Kiritimatiellia bacterium]